VLKDKDETTERSNSHSKGQEQKITEQVDCSDMKENLCTPQMSVAENDLLLDKQKHLSQDPMMNPTDEKIAGQVQIGEQTEIAMSSKATMEEKSNKRNFSATFTNNCQQLEEQSRNETMVEDTIHDDNSQSTDQEQQVTEQANSTDIKEDLSTQHVSVTENDLQSGEQELLSQDPMMNANVGDIAGQALIEDQMEVEGYITSNKQYSSVTSMDNYQQLDEHCHGDSMLVNCDEECENIEFFENQLGIPTKSDSLSMSNENDIQQEEHGNIMDSSVSEMYDDSDQDSHYDPDKSEESSNESDGTSHDDASVEDKDCGSDGENTGGNHKIDGSLAKG